jgi:uncharacterized membrane protein
MSPTAPRRRAPKSRVGGRSPASMVSMPPASSDAPTILTLDMKVILFAVATALLTSAGTLFQKLNGLRGGNSFLTIWLLLATACFFPTFVLTNKAFLMGGKMSLYVPVTAASYVLSMFVGRFYFGEAVSWERWLGCALIVAGIGTVARG